MLSNYMVDEFFDDNDVNVCNMKCDIYEKDNGYMIELDVPGYDKSSLKVEYSNGYVSVLGSKKEETVDKNKKYIRRERNYGVYKRQFYVGEIDYAKIVAKYFDGTLKISIPKPKVVSNVKNIVIK